LRALRPHRLINQTPPPLPLDRGCGRSILPPLQAQTVPKVQRLSLPSRCTQSTIGEILPARTPVSPLSLKPQPGLLVHRRGAVVVPFEFLWCSKRGHCLVNQRFASVVSLGITPDLEILTTTTHSDCPPNRRPDIFRGLNPVTRPKRESVPRFPLPHALHISL